MGNVDRIKKKKKPLHEAKFISAKFSKLVPLFDLTKKTKKSSNEYCRTFRLLSKHKTTAHSGEIFLRVESLSPHLKHLLRKADCYKSPSQH